MWICTFISNVTKQSNGAVNNTFITAMSTIKFNSTLRNNKNNLLYILH